MISVLCSVFHQGYIPWQSTARPEQLHRMFALGKGKKTAGYGAGLYRLEGRKAWHAAELGGSFWESVVGIMLAP